MDQDPLYPQYLQYCILRITEDSCEFRQAQETNIVYRTGVVDASAST